MVFLEEKESQLWCISICINSSRAGEQLWHWKIVVLTPVSRSYCCLSFAILCLTFCEPHRLQNTRVLCPILPPRVCWNSWPVNDAISTSHPLPPPSPLPSIFPSIRVFSNELTLHITWPKYWSFTFNISPSNEYSRFISFRIDWFDLAIQGTSPAPQFESTSSSALSLLYGSTHAFTHEYWKSHTFVYADLCWQFDVSVF